MILLVDQDEIGNRERYDLVELAERTTLDHEQKEWLAVQIRDCRTLTEYEEIERYLYQNIIQDKDRIAMGLNYNAGDIKKTIRNITDLR